MPSHAQHRSRCTTVTVDCTPSRVHRRLCLWLPDAERTPKRSRRMESVLDALADAQSRLGAMAGALQRASRVHVIAGTAPQPWHRRDRRLQAECTAACAVGCPLPSALHSVAGVWRACSARLLMLSHVWAQWRARCNGRRVCTPSQAQHRSRGAPGRDRRLQAECTRRLLCCLRVAKRTLKRGRRAERVLDALPQAQSRLSAMAGALQQASHRHAIAGTAPQPRPSPVTVAP